MIFRMKPEYGSYCDLNRAKKLCRSCPIFQDYGKVVLSDGCEKPKVLIIGECPGKDEVVAGMPFVGKAGKLLRPILNKLGFRKTNALITNVIPCRPKDNQFPNDEDLVTSCMQRWLFQEIVLTKPDYILLLGATPTHHLLGLKGITKIRGVWVALPFWLDLGKNIMCMPTLHPSYVLRKENMEGGDVVKAQFESDIRSVAEKAGFWKPEEAVYPQTVPSV